LLEMDHLYKMVLMDGRIQEKTGTILEQVDTIQEARVNQVLILETQGVVDIILVVLAKLVLIREIWVVGTIRDRISTH